MIVLDYSIHATKILPLDAAPCDRGVVDPVEIFLSLSFITAENLAAIWSYRVDVSLCTGPKTSGFRIDGLPRTLVSGSSALKTCRFLRCVIMPNLVVLGHWVFKPFRQGTHTVKARVPQYSNSKNYLTKQTSFISDAVADPIIPFADPSPSLQRTTV